MAEAERFVAVADGLDAEALSNRGAARRDLGDLAGAIDDYRKALEAAPLDWPRRATIEG